MGCGGEAPDEQPTEEATTEETTAAETTAAKTTVEETFLGETAPAAASLGEEEAVMPEANPEGSGDPAAPEAVEDSVSLTPEECYPSCQGAAIRRGEVPLTEQEEANLREQEILAPEVEVPRAPTYQSTDPDGPYYRPPEGPCLGQCTDAYGRNNAEIQTDALREGGLLP